MKKKFIDYVKNTIWKDDTDDEIIKKLSKKAFNDMTKNKTKKNYVFRICGQSGSGKTTQLMASIEKVLNEKKLNPVIVAVRNFAKYHPKYDEYLNIYGKAEIREKTNGFALKLLGATLVEFFENNYLIVMDITLLDENFENLVLQLMNKYKYKSEYHIMSVPKKISDFFIEKRLNSSISSESKRIVYKSSSDFFYNILPQSLEYLTKTNKNADTYIWSAFDYEPVFVGKMEESYNTFIKYRKCEKTEFLDESILMHKKVLFISKNSKID